MSDLIALIQNAITQATYGEDNPIADASLEQIERGFGIGNRDLSPEEREARREQKRKRDRISAAKRRERKAHLKSNPIERPKPAKMNEMYERVVIPAWEPIKTTVRIKSQRIARHIGYCHVEDVVADAMDRICVAFCRYENITIEQMEQVAQDWRDRTSLPRHLDGTAKIMAQTINIQAKKASSQWWRNNPTLESIERLATMEYNSAGVDEVVSQAAADGDLSIVGWRPAGPGKVDPNVVAIALAKMITVYKLDAVADEILGQTEDAEGDLVPRVRTDGAFPYHEYADEVWAACGLKPEVLAGLPDNKKAAAARTAVRNRFERVEALRKALYAHLSEFEWETPR